MYQHTLVSYYGNKPAGLTALLITCRDFIKASQIGDSFKAYETGQVHGTLIGLEAIQEKQIRYNMNMCFTYKQKQAVQYPEINSVLSKFIPIQFRIGGFSQSYSEYKSRGQLLYNRSFLVDRQQARVVLMGWPYIEQTNNISENLLDFRTAMHEQCFIAHKYPNDNDYYMVLGELDDTINSISSEYINALEETIRDYLANNPITLNVESDDILVARYEDARLPFQTTQAMLVSEYIQEYLDQE